MHRGCFVSTPTPPLAGRGTPRPGLVRVCVCVLSLSGRAGQPPVHLLVRLAFSSGRSVFLFARPPLGCDCPFPGPLFALPFFSLPPPFFFAAPPLSLAFFGFRPRVPWALALYFSPPPPPGLCFFLRPLCLRLSLVSGPGCPGPWRSVLFVLLASRFSALCALSPRLCFLPSCWLLSGGCCPPPPPFVSHGFRRCFSLFGFFFLVVRPRCLWLLLVSGPGCPGPWRRWLFVLLASGFTALRALSPRWCFPRRRWLLSGGCCPPPTPLCRAFFVARCSVVCFFFPFFRSAPPLSLPPLCLALSGFQPRTPWALALCAVCFGGPPLPGSLCALSSYVFPASPFAAPCCLLSPPSPLVSRDFRRCLSVLVFFCAPPLSLAFSGFQPRVPCALALCVVLFFVGLPLLGSLCALASSVFPAWPWAALWCLLPSPPFCVSRFSSLPLGAPFFVSLCAPVVSGFFWFPATGALGLGAVCCLFPARLVLVPRVLLRPASCRVVLRSVVCFVLCLVLCGVLLSGCVLALCCGGSCCAVFVVLCCGGLLRSLLAFRVLRAFLVSVLCLCGGVPVCLRRCSLRVALLPLRRWLVFWVVVCCVCVFAVGPGCPLFSSVGSWWVLVSCFGGVLWCVPGCCAAPRCCVSCRLALRCFVLSCFVLLCLVLSRAVSCLGALSVILWSCVLGAVFCLVSPRCVCFAVVCCCLVLCFVPCASWGVVLCVPCPLRPVRCCCASLLALGALLPCAVPRSAVLPCGVVVSSPAALFVWFLLLVKPVQNWFLFKIKKIRKKMKLYTTQRTHTRPLAGSKTISASLPYLSPRIGGGDLDGFALVASVSLSLTPPTDHLQRKGGNSVEGEARAGGRGTW